MERDFHQLILTNLEGINSHLAVLNSKVASHEKIHGDQAVLNAQVTLTQTQLVESMKTITNKVEELSEYQIRFDGGFKTFKWLFGFLGFGNIIMFIKVLSDVL